MKVISSFTALTVHEAASVYARWADPSTWPEWDPEVRKVVFDSPIAPGRKGKVWPKNGPAMSFSIKQMRPDRVFTNSSRLPGTTIEFEHVVEPSPDGSSVTVTVRLLGPLASIWKLLIGAGLKDAARSSVDALLAHLDTARP